MATKAQFDREVAKHGAAVDMFDSFFCVDLPAGKTWDAGGTHSITEYYANTGGQSWKPQAYQDAIDQMRMGTSPCEDPACDVCHPVDEDNE